jgi:hypothetical protein
MLIERLEEAIASLDRLRQSNELLQIEKKSIEAELKAKTRGDISITIQRKMSKLGAYNSDFFSNFLLHRMKRFVLFSLRIFET